MTTPTYLPDDLYSAIPNNAAACAALGLNPCPITGRIEEYQVLDRLGGEHNIWPQRFRGVIEAAESEL